MRQRKPVAVLEQIRTSSYATRQLLPFNKEKFMYLTLVNRIANIVLSPIQKYLETL